MHARWQSRERAGDEQRAQAVWSFVLQCLIVVLAQLRRSAAHDGASGGGRCAPALCGRARAASFFVPCITRLCCVQTLHCDLALRNLLLDHGGVVRVADFGLATLQKGGAAGAANRQKPVAWTGEPHSSASRWLILYCLLCSAPEAFFNAPTAASDVFSFGVVLVREMSSESCSDWRRLSVGSALPRQSAQLLAARAADNESGR